MHYDVIIVGAGPGGLACATKLAKHNVKTLVIERKPVIGPKSCAGGITWSGLIRHTPEELIEKVFPEQYVFSKFQKIVITEDKPIIATINREKFGQFMAQQAIENGVEIKTSTSVQAITKDSLHLKKRSSPQKEIVTFNYLVGADGSSSLVRKFLKIPTEKVGIGINYQINGHHEKMEWHLNCSLFQNGYGWIFPHKETISIGAYLPQSDMAALELQTRLCKWAHQTGFDLFEKKCTAGFINYDYRGYHFDNVFLVGDAAGLASALTGEGIYPAIVSGKIVASLICDPSESDPSQMRELIKKNKRFSSMVQATAKSNIITALAAEAGLFGLRCGLLNFSQLEMG